MQWMPGCWRAWVRRSTLNPQAPCFKEIRILKDLHVACAGRIKDRTRLRNRDQTQNISVLKRQTKTRLTLVRRQIAELDAEIATLIEAQESTARRCHILRFMPRVGAVTAAAMLTLMPEIGTLDRKQAASLAGLAPIFLRAQVFDGQRPSPCWFNRM